MPENSESKKVWEMTGKRKQNKVRRESGTKGEKGISQKTKRGREERKNQRGKNMDEERERTK